MSQVWHMDALRPRRSVAEAIEAQGALPMAVVIVIAVVAQVLWWSVA